MSMSRHVCVCVVVGRCASVCVGEVGMGGGKVGDGGCNEYRYGWQP